MFALCGFYVSDVPVLGDVFRGAQPTPGEHGLASVHRGLHEGLAGTQLAITALLLSRALGLVTGGVLRAGLSLYLALMLCYGVMVAAQDGWNEQLIKRGIVSWDIPSVLTPRLSAGWAIVILAALAVHFGWFRREPARSTPSGDTTTAGRSS
jgi:Mn2+/Fe2+ NRAMP family transporter